MHSDAVNFVRRFHSLGIRQAAISNSRRIIMDANLKHLGIYKIMATIVSRDQCVDGKPYLVAWYGKADELI